MKKIILSTIILCLMANLVLGAGFVLPYMKDGKMNLHKGDSEAVWVVLQNGENKTFIMEVTQTTGQEIAYLMNDTYMEDGSKLNCQEASNCSAFIMPPYTYDRRVYFNVSVSKDAKVGDEWEIGFTVRSKNPNAAGMVTFATQVGGGFTVSVVEDINKKFVWTAWHTTLVILVVIVLCFFGGWVIKRHKKRKEDEQKSQDPLENI